jgi:hypothetical protein
MKTVSMMIWRQQSRARKLRLSASTTPFRTEFHAVLEQIGQHNTLRRFRFVEQFDPSS